MTSAVGPRTETAPPGRDAPSGPAALVLAALAIAALLSTSCALAPRPGPTPGAAPAGAPSAAKPCPAGTISLLNRGLSSVRSIEASLNIGISVEEPAFATRVQAGLAADDDSNFRLRAYLGPVCLVDVAAVGDSVWAYFPSDAAMFVGTMEEAIRSTPDRDMTYVMAAVSLRDVLFPAPFVEDSCSTSVLDRSTCLVTEHVTGPTTEDRVRRPRELYQRPGGEPVPARLRFLPWLRERTAAVETRKGRLKELNILGSGEAGENAKTGTGGSSSAGDAAPDVTAPDGDYRKTRTEVTAAYSDYRKTGRGVFPHKVAVEFPGPGIRLTLSFARVEVNPAAPAETFHVSISDGVTVHTFNKLSD